MKNSEADTDPEKMCTSRITGTEYLSGNRAASLSGFLEVLQSAGKYPDRAWGWASPTASCKRIMEI
jgi:hypothetical protein